MNRANLGLSDLEHFRERLAAIKVKHHTLNLTRGIPSPAQLELSQGLRTLPGGDDYVSEDGVDCRNYGGLQGLLEARRLFAGLLSASPEQVVVSNNSSLSLMHDVVVYSLLKGTCDSSSSWSQRSGISFLCPVPGYDRHFRICEEFGIRMIPVTLRDDGPAMDQVEPLVAQNVAIKGMWCMPMYSNPSGVVYSDEVIERLAMMRSAAADFRLYWDHAYAVHHLTSDRIEIPSILELCAHYGFPNRPYVFSSTSKITWAGSGLALFASSQDNVRWLLDRMSAQTIGPDKVNQLRHVRFLKDAEGIGQLMDCHRALIAPKFQKVIEVFTKMLASVPGVRWTEPKGGYFITLTVPHGCARRVIELAAEVGIQLTPAGATHPYGIDPDDCTIRIAPTFPELEQISEAAEAVAWCVLLTVAEKAAEPHSADDWPA